jgi:hypothetical protein
MKLLARSALIATVAAASLFAATSPSSACIFSKPSATQDATSFDGSPGLFDNAPDSKTLGIFGIVASLLTGGVVLYRKRRLARLAEQKSAIATEFELTETLADDVVTAADTDTDVAVEEEVVLTR